MANEGRFWLSAGGEKAYLFKQLNIAWDEKKLYSGFVFKHPHPKKLIIGYKIN